MDSTFLSSPRGVLAAALAGGLALIPTASQACELVYRYLDWELGWEEVADPEDQTAPGKVGVDTEISRVNHRSTVGKACELTQDHVVVSMDFTLAEGDEWADVGLVFELVEGEIPAELYLGVVEAGEPVVLTSRSIVNRPSTEPFAFTFTVTPQDRAGNVGETTEVEVVWDGGRGCSVVNRQGLGGAHGLGGLALGLSLLGLGLWRRREP